MNPNRGIGESNICDPDILSRSLPYLECVFINQCCSMQIIVGRTFIIIWHGGCSSLRVVAPWILIDAPTCKGKTRHSYQWTPIIPDSPVATRTRTRLKS